MANLTNENFNLTSMVSVLGDTYTTLKLETTEEKLKLFNVLQAPTSGLKDMINVPFKIDDIYVERIVKQIKENEKPTGEVYEGYKIILFSGDKSYVTTSSKVFNSLSSLFTIFGDIKGLKVVAKNQNIGGKDYIYLELAK